jgi:hypothetical protein
MLRSVLVLACGLVLAACDDSESLTRLTEDSDAQLQQDGRTHSVARLWNEMLLEGIRSDLARPTVHARNLWHVSAAMYDAWAAFDSNASPWLLGGTQNNYSCEFGVTGSARDPHRAREQAISYAAYRVIRHRFAMVPRAVPVERIPVALFDVLGYDIATMPPEIPFAQLADDLMAALGYDASNTDDDYQSGSPAALGNHIAGCYIAYGLSDGANEAGGYAALVYTEANPPIDVEEPGNPNIVDLNRWQRIRLTVSIDQGGNQVASAPPFVSPEWGVVDPFSLTEDERTTCTRAGFALPVFHDPGPPPYYVENYEEYKWTHAIVARLSSQLLDPDDPNLQPADIPMIDISPNNIGNIQSYPTNFVERQAFYEQLLIDGTTADVGYTVNPATGAPYAEQWVPLSDYARTVAEFWADGPDSETPPGHWFVISNTVSDHPALVKQFEGAGRELGPLEWDVKIYFALGGAMHDAAITAWSIKGCYDYLRPVAAIRAMADRGQSSDINGPSYHVDGIPLYPGQIEVVLAGDPLAGAGDVNVGKIKVYAWLGEDFIKANSNPNFDTAGAGWTLAETWWPYQRPTFVTPPFAGYISGHSTYSRTAAELLTLFTGDEYFPGGKSEFEAPRNQFLVFEDGPSVDLTLEWARYVDASDQCSLSRIWGGIHPPADDLPGRAIGVVLGPEAFNHAKGYFNGTL